MRKMKKGFALGLAATMFLLSACSGQGTASGDQSSAAEDAAAEVSEEAGASGESGASGGDVIKIGCPQPLTGTNALVGDSAVKGAQLAAKEINEAGGILGKQVEVIVYDDQASPEEAVKIATKLIEVDQVDVVVGSLISSCVLSSGQYFDEVQIPCIGTGLSSTWMEQGWEYVFRACPNSGMGMPALAEYMKSMGITKIAIFQGQDESSASGANDMRAACEDAGIEVLTSETYVEGDTDYSGQIAKILNTNPQAVFTSTFSVTQAPFAKQLRQFGYEGLIFNKETLSVDNIRVAGDAGNGYCFMFPYVTYATIEEIQDPVLKEFNQAFYDEYGEMPYHDCAYRAYDSMMVFKEAIEIAGTTDGEAVKDAILTINDFESLGGTQDFTRGDREGMHIENFKPWIVWDGTQINLEDWLETDAWTEMKATMGL